MVTLLKWMNQNSEKIHEVKSKVWKQEKLPEEWKGGLIYPVYKKGYLLNCQNYRGITLLNTAYKVFSNILYERLKSHVEKVIANYQCGFRSGKSTVDQIHTFRQILEKTKGYNVGMYHHFVDFKAAYDSIYRDKLFKAMEKFAIPTKLTSLTKITLSRVKFRVKTQNNQSALFVTEKRLRQGDALACILFNIALERDAENEERGSICHKSMRVLAYADIDIIGRTRAVKEIFLKPEKAAQEIGLTVNESKTKYMEITCKPNSMQYLIVNNYKFEEVNEFKYLGTLITANNNLTQ
jgi:sorting nexin-29